jgi:CBS domain-containing protein
VKVEEILARKGRSVFTIKPTDTIEALCRLLREKKVGAAVVSADGRRVDGVITERDIAFGIGAKGADVVRRPVEDLMTKVVITCTPADDVAFVASTMASRNIRHLPVVEDSGPVGMISIRDVLYMRVSELQQDTALLHSFYRQTMAEPQDRE